MSDDDRDIGVISWEDGDDVIQASTIPMSYGGIRLIIKRYTKHAYNSAINAGAHQTLFDRVLLPRATRTNVMNILERFGCPDSKLR